MLITSFLLTIHAAAALSLTTSPLRLSASKINSSRNLESYHSPKPTTYPSRLTFLGIQCYHLLPETVTLLDCQGLFDKLFQYTHVYEKVSIRSGWHLQNRGDPCVIKVVSSERESWSKRVSLSVVDVVSMAIDVLKECQEGGIGRGTGTGGANVFEGSWRVTVSREELKLGDGFGFGVGLGVGGGDADGGLRGDEE